MRDCCAEPCDVSRKRAWRRISDRLASPWPLTKTIIHPSQARFGYRVTVGAEVSDGSYRLGGTAISDEPDAGYLSRYRYFPKHEVYGLTQQMRRAAVSVPSNIAEGKGHKSDRELSRFLLYARGSLLELQTQVMIAKELQYLDAVDGNRLLEFGR